MPHRRQPIKGGQALVYCGLVMAKMKSGMQFEPRACFAFNNAINEMDRVLQMEQQHTLLKHEITDVICPNWQSIFQSKFMQIFCCPQIELTARAFRAAEGDNV